MKALVPAALLDLSELDSPPRPPRYLVDGLIETGAVVLFAGDSGAAKSTIALDLAVALVQGRRWLGRDVKRGRCVYVDAENDRRLVLRRLHALGMRSSDAGLRYWTRPPLQLSDPGHVAELREEIRQHRPSLLILDTALSLAGGIDANDNSAVATLYVKVLRRIAEDHGCVVLLTHHEVKAASGGDRGTAGAGRAALGAMSWRGQADLHIAVERARGAHARSVDARGHALDTYRVRLRLPKQRDYGDGAEVEDVAVVSEKDAEGAFVWMRVERTGTGAGPTKLGAVERIAEALRTGGPYTRAELAEAVGMKATGGGFKGACAEVLRKGQAVETEDGRMGAGETS